MKTSISPGKTGGNFYGLGTYLGLAGALLAMIALFSLLSDHFLSYDTFSTLANRDSGPDGAGGGHDLHPDHWRHRPVCGIGIGIGGLGSKRGDPGLGLERVARRPVGHGLRGVGRHYHRFHHGGLAHSVIYRIPRRAGDGPRRGLPDDGLAHRLYR